VTLSGKSPPTTLNPGVSLMTFDTAHGTGPDQGSHQPNGYKLNAGTENAPGVIPLSPHASVGTLTTTWVTLTVSGALLVGGELKPELGVGIGLLSMMATMKSTPMTPMTIRAIVIPLGPVSSSISGGG
jgi:hypothetical protein